MSLGGFRRVICACALALVTVLAFAATAGAADQRRLVIRDDCDPATFNAAIGPGTCVGDGRTTFGDFFGQLAANGAAKRWTFSRDEFGIDAGGKLTIVNRGGETHSFTPVTEFVGGCVPPINVVLGLPQSPLCDTPIFPATLVPAGGTLTENAPTHGIQRYQCLIHPWMQAVAVVKD